MRIRINLSPKTHDISGTKVFISYKTKDWDYAKSISKGLSTLGFQTAIVPPGPPDPNCDVERIRRKLFDLLQDSDFLCLITTYDSLKSDWVMFEFKEAAALVGRVLFACPDSPISGYESVDHLGCGDLWRTLFVKHTTVSIPEVTDAAVQNLAVELINDPDEGWYNGRGSVSKRMPKRGLRQQSRMRQYARKCVLVDHKYQNEVVRDVIPFTWGELDCVKGDRLAALKALILDGGRLNLENAFARNEVDIFHAWYYADEQFLTADDFGLDVFVVVERHERNA
jgi:hypothetical protein